MKNFRFRLQISAFFQIHSDSFQTGSRKNISDWQSEKTFQNGGLKKNHFGLDIVFKIVKTSDFVFAFQIVSDLQEFAVCECLQ